MFTNNFVLPGRKCITADIALKGSDILIVGVWDGFRLIDVEYMDISKGDEVIKLIKDLAHRYKIPQSEIVYDDDGAGSFIDGFIKNARGFNNSAKALRKENYYNRKTQMHYKMADRVHHDGYYICEEVAKKKIGKKTFQMEKPDWFFQRIYTHENTFALKTNSIFISSIID